MYYFERVENTRGRNVKMCLFPRRGKKSSFLKNKTSMYIYYNFHEVGKISPMVLFPRREKKVKNTSYRNFKLCKLSKTV